MTKEEPQPLLADINMAKKLLGGISRSTLYRRMKDDPDFPQPNRRPTGEHGKGGKNQWLVEDIKRYTALFANRDSQTTTASS